MKLHDYGFRIQGYFRNLFVRLPESRFHNLRKLKTSHQNTEFSIYRHNSKILSMKFRKNSGVIIRLFERDETKPIMSFIASGVYVGPAYKVFSQLVSKIEAELKLRKRYIEEVRTIIANLKSIDKRVQC